jgi:general stress protein 26
MDSINRNQPEVNRRDLSGPEAVKRLQKMAEDADTCFFTTDGGRSTRPMGVRKVDDAGNLWFLSADDSHKNAEVQADPHVALYLQTDKHSGFLRVEGRATISRDAGRIKDLWNPLLRTWFTGGEDDPRITVIQVTPASGYYWDNKHGDAVAAAKVAVGAVIGKTLDDSIEGTLAF